MNAFPHCRVPDAWPISMRSITTAGPFEARYFRVSRVENRTLRNFSETSLVMVADFLYNRGFQPGESEFQQRAVMFAIFEDGSRQYRVQPGDELRVDFRGTVNKGDALNFDKVLAATTESTSAIGRPYLSGATVQTEVLFEKTRGEKLEVGKFKRRKSYIRHNGHVQLYTTVRVKRIDVPGFQSEDAPAANTAS